MKKYGQVETRLKKAGAKGVMFRKIREKMDIKIMESKKATQAMKIIEAPAAAGLGGYVDSQWGGAHWSENRAGVGARELYRRVADREPRANRGA